MSDGAIAFAVGLVVGANIGIFVLALLMMGRTDDDLQG